MLSVPLFCGISMRKWYAYCYSKSKNNLQSSDVSKTRCREAWIVKKKTENMEAKPKVVNCDVSLYYAFVNER